MYLIVLTISRTMNKASISMLDLLDDDVGFLMFLLFRDYGSLNLKQLTEILDTPKTSVHRKIKDSISKGLIELDDQKSLNNPGMFYRNSSIVNQAFNQGQRLSEQEFQQNPKLVSKNLSNLVKSVGALTKGLSKLYAKKIVENPNIIEEEVFDDRGVGLAFIGTLELHTDEDLLEFRKILLDFIQKKTSKYESTDQGISHTVTLSVFPLKKIFPEGIDSVQK